VHWKHVILVRIARMCTHLVIYLSHAWTPARHNAHLIRQQHNTLPYLHFDFSLDFSYLPFLPILPLFLAFEEG
jgi:hypothetical protein